MAWDFENIIAFGQQFGDRPAGTELAFVFSTWTAQGGLDLVTAYPAVRANVPPTEPAPAAQVARLWVKLNNGAWQLVTSIPSVTAVGLGSAGVLQSGVEASMVIAGWPAKGIGAGYIIASGATLNQINTDRNAGLALIRTYVNSDETAHPLGPDNPFTSPQVSALSAWLNAHGVTNGEFAALFDVTAAQLAGWLTSHPRWQFAKVISEKFG